MPIESQAAVSTGTHRIGDAQRAGCAEVLTDAFVKGELSQAEFDARTELCLTAVTAADIARLTRDLPAQVSSAAVSPGDRRVPQPGAVKLSSLIGFEVVLLFVAYVLGVDLESELRSAYVIAFEIWAVGSLAALTGALLLRPVPPTKER
jgi:hypothetical protein